MTDVTKQDAVTEPEVEATVTEQTKTGKTFTQEELNAVVAREKAAWKRSITKDADSHETIMADMTAQMGKRDEVITKQIELLRKDTKYNDDKEWKLLSDGRDVLWQFDLILGEVEKAGKKEIPPTPPGFKDGSKTPAFSRTTVI